MSTTTNFKRIALAVVASLGISLLSTGPSANGAIVSETLTLGAATATVTAGETATTTLTTTFTPTVLQDSITILSSCYASVPGLSCPAIQHFWSPTADSTTVTQLRSWKGESGTALAAPQVSWQRDSFSVSSSTAGAAVSATTNIKVVTTTSTTAATYTYTIYTATSAAGATAASTSTNLSRTFAVTVSALNTTVTSARTYVGYSDAQSGWYYTQANRGNGMVASSDSAVVSAFTAGSATSANVSAAAYVNLLLLNSAGETRTTTSNVNICQDTCSITAIIAGTGGGLIATGNSSSIARTAGAKSVTMNLNNLAMGLGSASDDTLTIYADGGAGASTVTFYSGGISLGSVSVTFGGAAASANIALMDTVTSVGQLGDSITAIVKDSGGNALTSGTLYVYASDTKVVSGALSTDSAQFTQRAAGLAGAAPACTTYRTALGAFTCDLGFLDTGTATITLRDSWTVAASTWVSNEVVVTVLGNSAKSYTVAFDKATYAPGERAVITITGLDTAGRALSNGILGTGSSISTTVTPSLGTQVKGTNGTQNADTGTFKGYVALGVESGVETRVVTMPTYSTDVTFEIGYTPALSTTATVAKASAKVVDPNVALIAAAQASSDAATDAANEAIDAANAATDAANLAAEAADAATVAAEEARDAADAATAAVEELATQVATLMAALKAQITTLANTVAKIAKKVKA